MPFVSSSVSQEEEKYVKDNLSEDDIKRCIKNATTALLCLGQNQSVIKKSDLNKLIKTSYRYHKVYHALVAYAGQDIYKTLGMRIFEFEDKYILVNSKVEFSKYIKHKPEMKEELVVLFFVLIHIFISPEEKSSERDLISALRSLDIREQDLIKIFANLIKKVYLLKRHEQEEQMYSWGPRAVAEVDPVNFFDCFLELAEGKEDDWPEQKRRIELLKKIHTTNSRVSGASLR